MCADGTEHIRARVSETLGNAVKFDKAIPERETRFDASMFDVRYQLLYSTAGTLAEKTDLSVLYVIVFRTSLYDEVKGAENYLDYARFMDRIGAERSKSGAVHKHISALDNRALHCIYEYIDV